MRFQSGVTDREKEKKLSRDTQQQFLLVSWFAAVNSRASAKNII